MPIRTTPAPAFEALIDALSADQAEQTYSPTRRPALTIEGLEAASGVIPNRALLKDPSGKIEKPAASDGVAAHELEADAASMLARLGLDGCTTESDVLALRRSFALRNHPDRLPPAMRQLATERMMAVNSLLDRHLARLRRGPTQPPEKKPGR